MRGITLEEARAVLTQELGTQGSEMVLPVTLMPAIEAAVASFDQVRSVAGMGGVAHLSFDQSSVEAAIRLHQIELTRRDARDLMVLQQEGLRIMREAS